MVIDENYDFGNDVKGISITPAPTPTPLKQVYQPVYTQPPTNLPQTTSNGALPWSDFANKDAYCKNFAQDTVESPKTLEIANEYYNELVNTWPTPLPGQDPLTFLPPPTFSQYYGGLKSDVYKSAYDECIKAYQ